MTQEWTVHEEFFPFVCEKCEKVFENHEIIRSSASYGYVNLTNGEFTFIGLICPSCNHITLKKYRHSNIKPAVDELFSAQEVFIAFIPDESVELFSKECTDWFLVPDDIPQLKAIDDPINLIDQFSSTWPYNRFLYRICEYDMKAIIDWENNNHKKILPRVISPISPYHKTEYLLSYLDDPESESNNPISVDNIHFFLLHLARDKYLYAEETMITEDEYRNLTIHYVVNRNYSYPDEFENICADLLNEYVQIRNDFDFEKSWKKDFLDKYILQIFYREGYYLSDQYYKDKQEFEKRFGKVFKNSDPKIDESQTSEIMTCQQVIKQLGIEPINLIGYIANGDLPAYYADYVYYDYKKNSSQNAFVDPEKFLYLSSEVEELLWRHPELRQSVPSIPNEKELPPEDKDAVEYARIIFEESKWNESLQVAVQIGLDCATKSIVFNSDELVKCINEIDLEIPVETIKTIWNTLPKENQNGNGLIESNELDKRFQNEYLGKFKSELNDKQARELPLKRKKITSRNNAIAAALLVTIDLQQEGKRKKREQLIDMIYKRGGEVTSDAINRIIQALPQRFRYTSGNPNKGKKKTER